jgi:biotin-(acetyl-CoA carboxylase) ligase
VLEGAERWEGVAVDLDESGALLVRDGSGRLRTVHAGDVSLRPAGEDAWGSPEGGPG